MKAQAPDEGPSDIGISASEFADRPIIEDLGVAEVYNPKLLRAISMKRNIYNTKSLVAAYNATTDKNERAVLLGWLLKYGERSDDCLRQQTVLEYSELARIAHRSIRDKALLRSLVHTLCSCVRQREFLRPDFAVALHGALARIDPSVYSGAAELLAMAKKLLSSLSPEPNLSEENYAEHEETFLVLHQVLHMVHRTNQTGIREREKKELRRSIAEKETEMELSSEHYPVNYHFKALWQAVERFEVKDPSSHMAQGMWCGLCGFLHVFHCLRNLMNLDIDPAAIADAHRRLRREAVAFGVPKRPWFDTLRSLMASRLEASRDEGKLPLFVSEYDTAMESLRKTIKGEDLKALRFGILQELRQLAIQTSSKIVREEVAKKLLTLTTSATFEE